MLSVIIPSYKDPLLHKTIDSILQNFTGEFEIIAVLDGYWTDIINDPHVKVLHLGDNCGMRGAINAGVAMAKGDYLMRTDEHCVFDKGFDEKMTSACKDNWIITARRYYLDTVKWEIMDKEPVDYEKLVIQTINGQKKFTGYPWKDRAEDNKDILIDETQAMQGSCWVMSRSWWDKTIKELDTENYGTMYQDSHEMVFKTWKAGGKLMVNKNTWFAHRHVSFTRSHNYTPDQYLPGLKYCYEYWKEFYQEFKQKWNAVDNNTKL